MWLCKDILEKMRVRAKPWSLVVWISLDAELGKEPSLPGTVFYVCISYWTVLGFIVLISGADYVSPLYLPFLVRLHHGTTAGG